MPDNWIPSLAASYPDELLAPPSIIRPLPIIIIIFIIVSIVSLSSIFHPYSYHHHFFTWLSAHVFCLYMTPSTQHSSKVCRWAASAAKLTNVCWLLAQKPAVIPHDLSLFSPQSKILAEFSSTQKTRIPRHVFFRIECAYFLLKYKLYKFYQYV